MWSNLMFGMSYVYSLAMSYYFIMNFVVQDFLSGYRYTKWLFQISLADGLKNVRKTSREKTFQQKYYSVTFISGKSQKYYCVTQIINTPRAPTSIASKPGKKFPEILTWNSHPTLTSLMWDSLSWQTTHSYDKMEKNLFSYK